MKKISIIIPSLNEETQIKKCLDSLNQKYIRKKCEIILVDGKSIDRTVCKAKGLVDKCLIIKPDRSNQLILGASVASCSTLVFLHADTILSQENIDEILRRNDSLKWGFFNIRFDIMSYEYKCLSNLINFRSRLFNICTGDQCMVIHRDIYNQIGGFPDIRLMEDLKICTSLKKIHPPYFFKTYVETSSRRWRSNGFILTVFKMHFLKILFYLGVNTRVLRELYK